MSLTIILGKQRLYDNARIPREPYGSRGMHHIKSINQINQ